MLKIKLQKRTRSVEDWKDGECPMEMIGDSTKEYCWKWETR